jgi:hypothetical protein
MKLDFNNVTRKAAIGIAAVCGGVYYMLQDPAVLALIPAPWGMVLQKFVTGITVGGVGYSMKPKADTSG